MAVFVIEDREWKQVFEKAALQAKKRSLIIAPFLQKTCLVDLLGNNPGEVKVMTRFKLDDFVKGVSDLEAIEFLLDIGAEVKGIKNLHSKVYIFNSKQAIVTSANLTQAALYRNHEFGVISESTEFVKATTNYFKKLWEQADNILNKTTLNRWKIEIADYQAKSGRTKDKTKLGDYGADFKFKESTEYEEPIYLDGLLPQQYFVKFFGTSKNRAARNMSIKESINDAGSHLFLSYPKGKRPRQVKDGDILYIARLVKDPNDIMIYGRVQGLSYVENRDDATAEDIKRRDWRKGWPHFIQVYKYTYIKGKLEDGISLNELMEDLHSDAFMATYKNALRGQGNVKPRKAYLQQAAVLLTPEAAYYLNTLFNNKLAKLGQLTEKELSKD